MDPNMYNIKQEEKKNIRQGERHIPKTRYKALVAIRTGLDFSVAKSEDEIFLFVGLL